MSNLFDFRKELFNLLGKQLKIDESKINSNMLLHEDLGLTSLDIIELLWSVEEKFDLTIPDEALKGIQTIEDLLTYVQKATLQRIPKVPINSPDPN